jgi:hypothetical protein
MLRATSDERVLCRVGETFTMHMYVPAIGDYVMLNRVVAFKRDRRIGWEPTPGDAVASQNAELPIGTPQGYSWDFQLQPDGGTTIVSERCDCSEAARSIRDEVQDGRGWVEAMHQTLERLACLVERGVVPGTPPLGRDVDRREAQPLGPAPDPSG